MCGPALADWAVSPDHLEEADAHQDPAQRRGPAHPLVQRDGGHAESSRTAPRPGWKARGAGGAAGDLPGHADRAGDDLAALDPYPRRGARSAGPVAPLSPVSSAPAGAGPGHPSQDILQERGRQPGGLAQAQHRHRPGLLQQGGRHPPPDDRDRCRPMGQRARAGRPDFRHRGPGVHGPREL